MAAVFGTVGAILLLMVVVIARCRHSPPKDIDPPTIPNDRKFNTGPYVEHIRIPRVKPEVVLFWVSNESPYFSRYNL